MNSSSLLFLKKIHRLNKRLNVRWACNGLSIIISLREPAYGLKPGFKTMCFYPTQTGNTQLKTLFAGFFERSSVVEEILSLLEILLNLANLLKFIENSIKIFFSYHVRYYFRFVGKNRQKDERTKMFRDSTFK